MDNFLTASVCLEGWGSERWDYTFNRATKGTLHPFGQLPNGRVHGAYPSSRPGANHYLFELLEVMRVFVEGDLG